MGLSEDQLLRFRADGFLFPIRAFSALQADSYLTSFREFQLRVGSSTLGSWQFKSHLFLTWVDEIVRDPGLLDAVESILGPDILCWSSGFFTKPPGSSNHVGWHQDVKYWGLSPADGIVTAWVALSDVARDSGPVQYWPGSHTRSLLPHVKTKDVGNTLYFRQRLSIPVDEASAVSATMAPGEASLHHPMVVHRSGRNSSRLPRVAIAVRFIATRVRGSARESAALVRGEDSFGHFELEPRPRSDFDLDAVAAHRRAMSLHAARAR